MKVLATTIELAARAALFTAILAMTIKEFRHSRRQITVKSAPKQPQI